MYNIALMIGGGIQETEALSQLVKNGWEVWITDRNRNCPCSKLASKHIIADGKDSETILRWILYYKIKEQKSPSIIFTLTELTTTVSILSEELKLPNAPFSPVTISQSKVLSKEVWNNSQNLSPKGIISNLQNIKVIPDYLYYPIVIKPDSGFGGFGVHLIKTHDDFMSLKRTLTQSELNNIWVIEEYIDGTLHDINGIFLKNGKFIPLSVSDRFWSDNISTESAALCPSRLSQDIISKLILKFETACRLIGINIGPVKGDIMVKDGEPYILEVASRIHGPRNSLYLIPLAYNRSILDAVLRYMISNKSMDWNIGSNMFFSQYKLIEADKEGVLRKINGIKKAINVDGVVHIEFYIDIGGRVKVAKNSTNIVGCVYAKGASHESCQESIEAALLLIELIIE